MKIPQKLKESNLLHKIISILTKKFPKLFQINSFGRPRKYQLGKVLALIVYCAKNNGNLSYRKIVKALKEDLFLVEILGFKSIPDFSIIFKIYKKYLKDNFNLYMAEITKSISKGLDVLYIDSSSLITNKLDKYAGIGKSTRLDWYYGYKVHLICSKDGLPLVFNITKANVSDINCKNLIDSLKINLNREKTFIIGDKGYDSAKLLKYIKSKGMYLLCPLNKRKAKKLSSQNIKDPLRRFNYELLKEKVCKTIYRKRWEIERLFGNLKENYGIDNHRVRGIARKELNVGAKLLLFTIEKAIAVLKILQYFCNSLYIL